MKTELVPIGNSRGIRIPKALIEQIGLKHTVEITVRPGGLLISPVDGRPRQGWAEAFVAAGRSSLLLPDCIENLWDADEWEWPAE